MDSLLHDASHPKGKSCYSPFLSGFDFCHSQTFNFLTVPGKDLSDSLAHSECIITEPIGSISFHPLNGAEHLVIGAAESIICGF